ncbi:MAG: CDP-diacylglycerol--glycerol-3-phosphate 3-phosphatidyltransferase [Alphaproteobacteria bacterium]|nr:CDP-diacylglycerol--glycerol-3-phosphate 3-phosphatidyltransferase [Alphaproteobacteria bacterium]
MALRLPNLLTLSRIVVIPALVGTFYLDSPASNWLALTLFVLAGITDFFDGWLARRNGLVSNLGRFLDPVADKLLVAAAIVMIVAFDRVDGVSVLAAVVIMCREIMVTGLREFLAEIRVAVPVSRLAKWKTALQMVAIGFLLLGDAGPAALPVTMIGTVLLWIAAILTLYTGYDYLRAGLRYLTDERPREDARARTAAD